MDYETWVDKVMSEIWKDYDGYTFDYDGMDKYAKPMFEKGLDINIAAAVLLADHKQIMRAVEAQPEGRMIH